MALQCLFNNLWLLVHHYSSMQAITLLTTIVLVSISSSRFLYDLSSPLRVSLQCRREDRKNVKVRAVKCHQWLLVIRWLQDYVCQMWP